MGVLAGFIHRGLWIYRYSCGVIWCGPDGTWLAVGGAVEKLWGFCEGNRADGVDLLGFCCFGGDFVIPGLWKKCGMLGVKGRENP